AAPNGFDVNPITRANYDIEEQTLAAYGKLNFGTENVTGNLGLRVVQTDQNSQGVQVVGGTEFPASFDNDYTYALPSLNVKWDINDDLVGRFAAYRSLTRPRLTDISPGRSLENFDGGNGTAGNPDLDPFTATNIDLGLEWYFAESAAATFAVFHKDLNGLIERTVEEVQVVDPGSGQTITINLSRPTNADGATVTGFEVGLQAPFSSGTGPLSNAGFQVNASFADSDADFTNTDDIRSASLEGLSEESYNAIVYYDVEAFNARLAYNWRSEFLQRVSGSGGNPISRDDYGQLDFSSTWNINDDWSLTLDILNLTDEELEVFTFQDPRFAAGTSQTGRRYLLSATWRM
ncbi:MAG: TonB-dependent receptor, partial [Rhodothermales bacterium]|nr:TonB-dependent receptor [Rhodothermales bacterium]